MIQILIIITVIISSVLSQSTCPVKTPYNNKYSVQQSQQHQCKCGIKTDGQIYIYCARKQLTELPIFTRSSILYEELILSGNQITKIPQNGFRGLRVKRLYLDNNPIQIIDQSALIELANYLEELVISIDQTQQIDSSFHRPALPNRLFKSLLNLKIVKLTGLELTTNRHLAASLFNRTRKLEVIHLIDCQIHSLDLNSFRGVEYSLQELNLDNNQIEDTNIIFSELERMKRLKSLTLSRNKIRRIRHVNAQLNILNKNAEFGSNMLSNRQLDENFDLDLSFNAINHIDEYAFSGRVLTGITELNLNNNELNQLQLGFIAQLSMLKELSLDYNKISYVPDNLFINARNLESLSLKGNFISQLGSEFAFSGLHFNLRRLNLAANKLRKIGRRVFMQTTKLRELNLERNELGSHFEKLLENNRNIKSIEYDPFQNTQLINTFEGIESELKTLNLENNHLKSEHLWSIVNLLNIESLRIGNNHFQSLNLHALKPVGKLTNLFKFYRNLTYLDMQNSSLAQLPYFIGLNRSLSSFSLAKNELCNVNANNLHKYYGKLKYLNLNSNPLECNMHLISLREWIQEITQSKFQFNDNKPSSASGDFNYYSQLSQSYQVDPSLNWKCASPVQLNNKHVNRLSFKELEMASSGQLQGNKQCVLDLDEFMTTTTRVITTTTPITTTTTEIPRTTTNDVIETVTPAESANLLVQKILFSNAPKSVQSEETQKESSKSFLNSMELKQTLLGSLIGAFLVLSIVCGILCVLKTTRTKLKDLSLCSSSSGSSNKTDKSQHISSTASSSSPYEMSKLTLQTMCINSSNSSASSGSSSSTNSTTNSSCNNQNPNDFFSKMDPLRLTLLNQASVYNQQYLNNCNLHYLASNLPYSPTDSLIGGSCTTSPSNNNDLNPGMVLLNDNTYDKLHQRFNTLNMAQAHNMSAASTLNYSQQNQLINKYIQNLNRQISAQNSVNNNTQPAETTPFLIIQNLNDANRLVNNNNNNLNQDSSSGLDNYQHTYHEIGDVLLNRANRVQINNNQQQQQPQNSDQNGNELFI